MANTKPKGPMSMMMPHMLRMIDGWEQRVLQFPGSHKALDNAPVRFEIMKEGLKRGTAGMESELRIIMPGIMLGMRASMTSQGKNPAEPKTQMTEGDLAKLEAYALAQGASSIGYTEVPAKWIFHGHGILHRNAIILTMEMDKVRMETAPSVACKQAVMEIYRDLGYVANKVARWLRKRGYSADAGHPLMGPVCYPPLAQMAGLGWLGRSGLIITPEHGPRVRLAAVFTNIENLPVSTQNEHAWVGDFCDTCDVCVRQCPTQAIYETSIKHDNGRVTCVDNDKCFPYFSDMHGCSVCIKVCPFNNAPYDKIKAGYEKHQQRES